MADTDPTQVARYLLLSGVYNDAWVESLALEDADWQNALTNFAKGDVISLGEGWNIVLSHETIAFNTILRIAGALPDAVVPASDICLALQKMIALGAVPGSKKRLSSLGKFVDSKFTIDMPSSAVQAFCLHIGASSRGTYVDFSTAHAYIETTTREEADILLKLEQRLGYAPSCWLSRWLESKPRRSTIDFTILPRIPFIVKDFNGPVRLLGVSPPKDQRSSEDAFVTMSYTNSGNIVVLQYRVSEQAVEGNSFNVRPECKEIVDGVYKDTKTGDKVEYNKNGKDARKLVGIGVVVRKTFPEYMTGETAYIFLDKMNGLSRVELGIPYDSGMKKILEGIDRDGIMSGLAENSTLPMAA